MVLINEAKFQKKNEDIYYALPVGEAFMIFSKF